MFPIVSPEIYLWKTFGIIGYKYYEKDQNAVLNK